MKRLFHIKSVVFVLMLFLCIGQSAADAIDTFKACRGISAPNSSVLVLDLLNGKVVSEYNSDKPLIPASIMKCVTVATLLDKMGVDECFETPVYITGEVSDGLLNGNILIVGSGDPSLNSRYEPVSADIVGEIAKALKSEGINKINGKVIIDESVFSGPAVPSSWVSGDLSQSYGTGSHGFNFEDNASGSRSVSNPAAVFESRLKGRLRGEGIEITGDEIPDRDKRLLLNHRSGTIDEIMRSCMMRSDNQYAEGLLRTYAVRNGEPGSTSVAANMVKKYWSKNGAPMSGITLIDGSGLSRQNRVTAKFMANVLSKKSEDAYYASFFPLAGQEGTLRNFMTDTPLEGYIAMKTGSMKGIQCYAGYKLDDDYVPTHVIVVIMNEMKSRASAREAVKNMLLDIFNTEEE